MLAECPIPELYGLKLPFAFIVALRPQASLYLRAVGFRHLVSGRIQPDEANCYVYQAASWPVSYQKWKIPFVIDVY
ncbi:hypothetical protein M404DRAFT_1005592 [Pisolithus tinctorius Marx 270]|uniref:Uncharacterized protein n=1 Tax=Pisolithus tinctorius Marx 270 TaxID=870435 RepID=A0A0C3NRC9_PISTI|nr:hypothetical protein M404DRAFT_1005592 [Pisolithus tinctorius Marx 270]